jgi:hypothetical protein
VPKATLVFDIPEENEDLNFYVNCKSYVATILKFNQLIHSVAKQPPNGYDKETVDELLGLWIGSLRENSVLISGVE